ncbi:DUF167 domain-containing protein [bacterium]|nr:DUF167 domain-containing protein [bacterium]
MNFLCLKPVNDGIRFSVYAVPKASKTEIVDLMGDRCKIRVKAPPVDGKANETLEVFLAKLFLVARRQVVLENGAQSKRKNYLLKGVTLEFAQGILQREIV